MQKNSEGVKKRTAKAVTVRNQMKCEYFGCTKDAVAFAAGCDEEGEERVYRVCKQHAIVMF